MIHVVSESSLPVGEKLQIRKNVFVGRKKQLGKRICIVTGTHGDELEGQYVAWKMGEILRRHPDDFAGTVEIWPAMNPMGVSTIYRGLPDFDLDMNRIFPGNRFGSMYENIAADVVDDLTGADLVIDIHASNIFLREIPQVRINVMTSQALVPMARHLNMDLVWVHASATVLENTLAYALNMRRTPTLVVEMGVGMRITKEYGEQLVSGILATMQDLGMWYGPVAPVRPPIISNDGHVGFVNADESGFFMPAVKHGTNVLRGDRIGSVCDSLSGEVKEDLYSPVSGLLFTLREYPVVCPGSLIARVLEG